MATPIDEQIAKMIIWLLYFIGVYFTVFWLSVLIFNPKENTKVKRKIWPEVTIILPMYNEEKHVEWTLDSVFSLDYPKNKLKVICVNDGSKDNTIGALKKLKSKYDFEIIDKKNGGKATAINAGLDKTKSPYFVVLDADCYVEEHSLKALIEEFDSKEIASVMPIMKVNKPQNVIQRVQWLEYLINITYKYIMGRLDCIHVVPGPFSAYKTGIVKSLGGFRHGHMTEDLEMALRLQDNHYKLKQSMSAVVHTNSPANLKAFVSQRTRWYQGTLLNVKDYKHFLFNKKYGEFGMFHMPLVTVMGILALLGVLTFLYLGLKNLFFTFKRWYLTNFDIITYITNLEWNLTLIDFSWNTIFMTLFMFLIVFSMVYLAFASTRERISVFSRFKFTTMFLYYFVIYNILMGYIWGKVLFKLILRKANKWEKVN